jgi:hypothetical protein
LLGKFEPKRILGLQSEGDVHPGRAGVVITLGNGIDYQEQGVRNQDNHLGLSVAAAALAAQDINTGARQVGQPAGSSSVPSLMLTVCHVRPASLATSTLRLSLASGTLTFGTSI